MNGGKRPQNDADPNLPVAARPKSQKPQPNWGPGFVTDPRARSSRARLCRVARETIRKAPPEHSEGIRLKNEALKVTKQYWADKKYDTQKSFGDIKKDLALFQNHLSSCLKAFDSLDVHARRELDTDRSLRDEAAIKPNYVDSVRASLAKLDKAVDNIRLPNYVKIENIAVPNCCNVLAELWERVVGRKFPSTADPEFNPRTKKSEFTSPGPHFVQQAMQAIDPEVGFGQVNSWIKTRGQRKKRKKSGSVG